MINLRRLFSDFKYKSHKNINPQLLPNLKKVKEGNFSYQLTVISYHYLYGIGSLLILNLIFFLSPIQRETIDLTFLVKKAIINKLLHLSSINLILDKLL